MPTLCPRRTVMQRRTFCLALIFTAVAPLPAIAAPTRATLYKNPQCTCCEGYAPYLRKYGFEVDGKPTNDLTEISQNAAVPAALHGCHTMFADNYVVHSHVPVNMIRKPLSD